MPDPIIRVENLRKKYTLRHERNGTHYNSLRETVAAGARNAARWFSPRSTRHAAPTREEFWALQDVSFEVNQGDVVGIVGRNGAGKSTLLKILSRITEPTAGRVQIKGRVASLLEVGTGFHPELTGRENIYLNGAILGMRRAEIRREFDNIVAFAEINKFLDTPIKRYSSGMYVRLAFAVAAHLKPEILIVDEVLAVGDAEFQKKCVGKMQEVSSGGRTVLFVSHQMAAVQNLCQRALLLDSGRLKRSGTPKDIILDYTNTCNQPLTHSLLRRTDRKGSGAIRFSEIAFYDKLQQAVSSLPCGEDASIRLGFSNTHAKPLNNVHISVGVENGFAHRVTTWSTTLVGDDIPVTPASDFDVLLSLPRLALVPGAYTLYLFATVNGEVADWLLPAGVLNVCDGDFFGTGRLPGGRDGSYVSEHSFTLLDPTESHGPGA